MHWSDSFRLVPLGTSRNWLDSELVEPTGSTGSNQNPVGKIGEISYCLAYTVIQNFWSESNRFRLEPAGHSKDLAPSMGQGLQSAFQAPLSSMMPASSPTHGIRSTGHHSWASMGLLSLPMSMKTSNTIQVCQSGGPPVLRRAFMPLWPVKWTRSCKMVKVIFTWVMATYAGDNLHVKFVSNLRKTEFIEVAKECNVPSNAGCIGMGYSKVGIFSRISYLQGHLLLWGLEKV